MKNLSVPAETDDAPAATSRWPISLALLVITIFAAWLRLHRLADHNLWSDEAFSVNFAHLPWASFWKVSWSREGNMLLYYLLLRPWVHLGSSEFVVRLLSVLFGLAAIPAIYFLGRDFFSRATGLIAAALLAVHAFHLYFSREARSYALLLFLLIAAAWLLVRFAQSPEKRFYKFAYVLASALALYAHLFAALVLASQWLAFGIRGAPAASASEIPSPKLPFQQLLRAFALTLLFALPIEAFAILKNKGQLNWIPPLTFAGFRDALYALTGQGGLWLFAIYFVLALIAAIAAQRSREPKQKFAARLLLLWLLFPIAVFLLYSIHRPLFYSRYLILCVPAAVLLAAEGIRTLRSLPNRLRWLWLPVLALVLSLSFNAVWRGYDAKLWPDWQSATHLVLANVQAGDAICFNGSGIDAFLYYWQCERDPNASSAWDFPGAPYSHGSQCFGDFPEQVARPGSRYQRVWLITTDPSPEQRQWIRNLFAPRFGSPAVQGTASRGPIPSVDLFPGQILPK